MGIPGNYIPKPHSFISVFAPDKILHLILFGVLAYLTALNLDVWRIDKKVEISIAINIIFGTMYGAFTELLQRYIISGRDGNYYDLLADFVGIIVGVFVYFNYKSKIEKIQYLRFLKE